MTDKERLIKLKEVLSKTGRSKTACYGGIKDGTFPKPIRIGHRSSRWLESEIDLWIKNQIKNNRS